MFIGIQIVLREARIESELRKKKLSPKCYHVLAEESKKLARKKIRNVTVKEAVHK